MDRPLAPPVTDSRLSRALSASARGTLLLIVPARLDEMAALLGAALRETVLQAAALPLETALRALQAASEAEVLHRRGDGFLVVLGDASPEHADTVTHRLLDALEHPVEVAGQRFCLGGCAGRVDFDAQSGHEVATLLRQADLASLEARRLGRGQCVRHEAATTMTAMRRLRAEDTLHRGVDQIRLDLLFEIQADMCTGALTGAVALPRWTPALGAGMADSGRGWAAVAADAGLMHRLTLMLLHGICRQVRQWRDQGLEVPSLSVDLPTGLWQDRALVSMVLDALVDQGLPGGTLTLLMPGAALSGDADLLRGMLRSLRATGVRVGLARLGDAGPVSLDTLGRLPLDELTLDARVLERLGRRDGTRMAAALIGLGQALGLRVVAEGVRSDEQLDFLRARHCDEFQGPVLSLPVGATTMTQVLMHARVQHRVVLDCATGTGPGTGAGTSAAPEPTRGLAHRTGRISITAAAG